MTQNAIAQMRRCSRCCVDKSLEEFHKNRADALGRQWSCKVCNNTASRERKEKDSEYFKSRQRELRYGISEEVFRQMLKDQNNVCAICDSPETATHTSGVVRELSVDHSHINSVVRGLLCQKCNAGLGLFGDDEQLLMNALDYLRRDS